MPGLVQAAAKLFCRGFCNRRPRQPHEAHISYLLQFKVDYNLLGMDFARLARVRWRGALPERSSVDGGSQGASASAVSGAPNAQSDATRGADGMPAAAATSTARSQAGPTQSRLRDPAFRCVWVRGQTHGLQLQSDAERVSSVELEADALYGDIVNVHDVSHEPLQSARDDLRLVASLNQIWQDENARRASKACRSSMRTPARRAARWLLATRRRRSPRTYYTSSVLSMTRWLAHHPLHRRWYRTPNPATRSSSARRIKMTAAEGARASRSRVLNGAR